MATDERLAGRRALVTGAAQGLGRAFAVAVASAGGHVAAYDRNPAIMALPAEPRGRRLDRRRSVLRSIDVRPSRVDARRA